MTGYILAGTALFLALAAIVFSRWRTARTMKRLDDMLAKAMDGSFSEETFDETRLSSLESRLAQFLAASAVSAGKLQEQRDQLSTLVSDISHQTKTPVANILLYAQLLEEQPLPPQGRECVQAISAQSEKLQTLIDALVKTSRLETGLLALHPKPGDIGQVIGRAMAQYLPKAEAKGVSLAAGQTEGSGVFDPKWTEEALCNLLDNAVKYTPPGGNVTVEVRNYEMFAAVRVSDTGPGIPESEQAKIFSRFYRASNVYHKEGVGIGLYLARQIAQGQGGYVKVASKKGGGSVFSLYFPRQ